MQPASPPEDILILGAGPAGMACAMELCRAGRGMTMVEKAPQVGGLAKTLQFEEPDGTYRTDIGPHRFYSKNPYLYRFIEDLLGEQWRKVPRHTRFYVRGKFYDYPIRLANVLRQIGIVSAGRMARDFLWERMRSLVHRDPPRTFEEYAVREFGRSLASFNMLQYTEKIWGIPCSQISVDWAVQRIGGLSVFATIRKALFSRSQGPKTLVDSFYYPSRGSGLIYEAIRDRIQAAGSRLLLRTEPIRILRDGLRVTEVTVRTAEGEHAFRPSSVASSIPITRAIELFDPPPPSAVREAAAGLRFRAQVYLFLTVNKPSVTRDNWIYFPDTSIPFGRVSEMKNFSAEMCPAGKTSLFVEFFCFEGDEVWQASKEDLFDRTMTVLERIGLLFRSGVTSVHHIRAAHVYPLYDLDYDRRLTVILEWLDGLENFYAIGRPGRFRYTNQDHSLEMGILAAQSILTGTRQNLDAGAENEYFEKGMLPTAVARQ
ncbi:MAG: amine oxidase [Candidatus Peregrinibacteria bacterium Greene0416_19]|nr:MAG: amine oxidase [Candidatus Peregrinibacteria bacterium Greene0416_19]